MPISVEVFQCFGFDSFCKIQIGIVDNSSGSAIPSTGVTFLLGRVLPGGLYSSLP